MPVAYDDTMGGLPAASAAPLPPSDITTPNTITSEAQLAALAQQYNQPAPTGIIGAGGGNVFAPAASANLGGNFDASGGTYRSGGMSETDFLGRIKSSPQYLGAMENLNLWNQQQTNQQAFDSNWADQFYQQNVAQLGAGDGLAGERDALNREQGRRSLSSQQEQLEAARQRAAREFAQQRKYVKEALTGRGNAGGQLGFEQGNLQFGYDQFLQGASLNEGNAQFAYDSLLKEIDLQGRSRDLEKSQKLQGLELNQRYTVAQAQVAKENLALAVSQKRGEALLSVASQLAEMWFDPNTGMYYDPSGQAVTVAQARASLADTSTTTQPAITAGQDNSTALFGRPYGGGY